jgi:hypothetical protein
MNLSDIDDGWDLTDWELAQYLEELSAINSLNVWWLGLA